MGDRALTEKVAMTTLPGEQPNPRRRVVVVGGGFAVAIMVNAGAAMVYSARTVDADNAKTDGPINRRRLE
jgi:hypothetical protein